VRAVSAAPLLIVAITNHSLYQTRKVAAHAKKHADEPNFVEVDLDGKELGDDGLAKVLEAISTMLSGDVGNGTFRLEELILSKNGVTTTVLPLLASIIQISSFDLRALDLSGNHLCVVTKEDEHNWEQFLNSFRTCRVMRRLDLSRNDMSKSLAMEIFNRVYFSHPAIDPNELEGSAPINDDMAALRELNGAKLVEKTNALTLQATTDPFFDPSASTGSLSNGVILKRRAGLRSIPYIVLRDVNMTDAGALHLSYILEHHYWPQYLMTTLKEGSHAAKVKEEDDLTHAFGVIYIDNPQISPSGQKMLAHAERARVELAGISEMSKSVKESFEDPVEFDFNQ
jgi:hypothetical protein